MILWTMQHKAVVDQLLKDGVYRSDGRFICIDEFRTAYDWLVEEMKKKIGSPSQGAKYPIWAWHTWEGKREPPEKYKDTIILKIDINESKALLSDYDDWHFVLNNQYLALNEHEWNDMENASKDQITESWQRIFDLKKHTPGWDYDINEKSIQATFWELRIEQVISFDDPKK